MNLVHGKSRGSDEAKDRPFPISQAIQACGAILVLDSELNTVVQASANLLQIMGVPAGGACESTPSEVLGPRLLRALRSGLRKGPQLDGPLSVRRYLNGRQCRLQIRAWRREGHVIVEIEPLFSLGKRRLLGSVNQWLGDLARASHPDDLLATLVESIADIGGFERVMVCHFESQGNGVVIAENQGAGGATMLGQRFASSFFPEEQRERFLALPLRSIPDLTSADVPLIPVDYLQQPDLSTSVLAAPSEHKREQCLSLNAGALLSLSVISENGLWGVVVCTSSRPQELSPTVRDATYTLVQMASQRLFLLKARIESAFLSRVQQVRERLAEDMSLHRTPASRLRESGEEWQALFRAHGIVIIARNAVAVVGNTPSETVIRVLANRLADHARGGHWRSECLHDEPLCHELGMGDSCGLLAVALPSTSVTGEWLMFFRPRHREAVYWSGSPLTPVISRQEARAAPLQQPLKCWQQEMRHHSETWERVEVLGAQDLAEDLAVLSSSCEIAELNEKLEEERKALARANEQLREMATRDSLTGLWNRYAMEQALDDALARAERYGEPFSVLLVDVDHFKQFNDVYGHETGDEVLRAVASIMAGALRETDRVGRWGGEEFVVIVSRTDGDDAASLAERLRALVENLEVPGIPRPVTASFGVACWQAGDRRKAVLARADEAMYRAKEKGRNRVERADGASVR
ncbi:diguanylate cyclase [Marinobacter sp.]|uniref:sensor domain-containing diguanylate cyclase n=1 Tax=Marinobacter sp. TaxID=50741 RepID=UPI0035696E2B